MLHLHVSFLLLLLCRFLVTALHEAHEENLIDELQLIIMQFSKFPAEFLDIPCTYVLLDKFSGSSIEKQELSLLTPESDQEKELHRAFSQCTQCVDAFCMWKTRCKEKANYRQVA